MVGMIDKETTGLRTGAGFALARWIGHAAEDIGQAFRVLQRIQYGEPWNGAARLCKDLCDAGPAAWR